ncbi:glutathione S-transferase-like [Anthonomus grandis grandis]|uniref:glutathione S-transferase-like n=1 Tax=Anthonomus grandis grandis TaxID=2921223 RepID=UPI00216637C7|nr:glutathione S-transferase-like [Anthonomus grandis grandis]
MPSYKLTYFDIPGIAQHIRYILSYANQPFEDVRLNSKEWPKLKENYPYGKLPIFEIDGKVFNQSNAIARYLAKQYGLNGKSDLETLEVECLADTLVDLRNGLSAIFYEKDGEKQRELTRNLLQNLFPTYLKKFEEIAAKSTSGWLVGSQITWADLFFASSLALFEEKFPGVLKSYPALTALVEKVENIPSIKAYLEKHQK